MIFLQKYGISLNLGAKIYQKYGQTVYGVLQENPYRLAEDISGVGFRIADEIASRIGIHTDSDYRIRSGMLYTLLQASGEGHIYLPKEELFSRASGLLGVDPSYMEKHLMDMVVDRKPAEEYTTFRFLSCNQNLYGSRSGKRSHLRYEIPHH